jgi:hypothetical protein
MTVRRRSLVQKSSLPLNIKPVHRYSAVDCQRSDDGYSELEVRHLRLRYQFRRCGPFLVLHTLLNLERRSNDFTTPFIISASSFPRLISNS